MNNQEATEIREKMIIAVKNYSYAPKAKNPRCPSIKKMYAYLLFAHPNWDSRLRGSSCEKRTKASGMTYTTGGGSRLYEGRHLVVKIDGNTVIDHDSTETYRENREVAEKILRLEKYNFYE